MVAILKPQIHAELVQEIVKAAHRDLDRVKELIELEPMLARASYDRGAGDWESALAGASHMGRADIVEYLLSAGAPIDIFSAAVLGHKAIVEAMLDAHPDMVNAKGAHGIPLLSHAEKADQEEIIALLKARGTED